MGWLKRSFNGVESMLVSAIIIHYAEPDKLMSAKSDSVHDWRVKSISRVNWGPTGKNSTNVSRDDKIKDETFLIFLFLY